MANAYVVASGEDDRSNDRINDEQLPRDLWTEVLSHTAASFAVDWDTATAYSILDPEGDGEWDVIRGIVSIILRYEFKLERRRPTGPRVLHARFTRCVSPWFKTTQEWLNMTVAQQGAVEHLVARSVTIAPFSELRVELPIEHHRPFLRNNRTARFVFVRRQFASNHIFANEPSLIELSPSWTEICRRELVRVRDQLQSLFHMDLRDTYGQLIQSPREIWD